MDIDGCARNTDPYTVLTDCTRYGSPQPLAFVIVPKARLKEICINRGGHLIPEETNHCELNIVSIFKGAAYE